MTELSSLSLFHKILVRVEDEGQLTLSDLATFGNSRQMLGALGRLEGLNYIERVKEQDKEYFVLTETGDTILADILEHIPQSREWDKKWRIILFDIPESRRTVRQMFRLKLMDLGARMLQSSVWITPYAFVADRFAEVIESTEFRDSVHIFESTTVSSAPINVRQLWDLDALEKEYKSLFASFKREVPKIKKQDDASYQAKCMIVSLALTMKKDPYLPPELMPKNWIGYESQKWYQELRQYCQ